MQMEDKEQMLCPLAFYLPFVLLKAGILKDAKSLVVLFLGLSGPVTPLASGETFTMGPSGKQKQYYKRKMIK